MPSRVVIQILKFLGSSAVSLKRPRGSYLYRCEEIRNCSLATKLFHSALLHFGRDKFCYNTNMVRRGRLHILVGNVRVPHLGK
jgi:hypothetical protein